MDLNFLISFILCDVFDHIRDNSGQMFDWHFDQGVSEKEGKVKMLTDWLERLKTRISWNRKTIN